MSVQVHYTNAEIDKVVIGVFAFVFFCHGRAHVVS